MKGMSEVLLKGLFLVFNSKNVKRKSDKILLFFFLLFPWITNAQVDKKQNDTTRYWEVATDLLWLIDKNQVPPFNLQIKKHLKANSSLRLRLGMKYNSNDSSYNSMGWPGPPYENRGLISFIRFGWETENKLNGKLTFYKGIDLGFWYERDVVNRTWYWSEIDTYIRYHTQKNTSNLEALPFIGFKYHFSNVFSISIESSFRLFYQKDEYSTDGYALPPVPLGGVSSGGYVSVNNKNGVELIPIQFLNFNVKIK